MKLLFNIENESISQKEFKKLLGYVDAAISFENMLPDIITATNEVKKIISNEVYNYLQEKYNAALEQGVYTDDYTDSDSNLIRSTRYPIAIKAYSLFAPTNDLSHTGDGRRMRTSDKEKMPFQWMVDEDNKQQEKRFYRSLDDLIDLLDESKPEDYDALPEEEKKATIYYKWINSITYKETKSNFVNTVHLFNKHFRIESRLLLMMLSSGLEECERREILPRIGKEKFKSLKEAEPTEDTDIELLHLIRKATCFYALAWAIPRMSISIFPEGVLQYQVSDRTTTNAKKPALLNETEYALQAFSSSTSNALIDIENLLKPVQEPSTEPINIIPQSNPCDKGFSAT